MSQGEGGDDTEELAHRSTSQDESEKKENVVGAGEDVEDTHSDESAENLE